MEKILSIENFTRLLTDVYEEYFSIITSERIVKRYFSDFDINQVKEKEIKGIIHYYTLYIENQEERLKKELENLGKLHYKHNIDFSLFIESVRILERFLIKDREAFYLY